MGEWQQGPLADRPDLAVLVAMTEDEQYGPPSPEDIEQWSATLGFEADALLLDPEREVLEAYADHNPGPVYSEAVTVILDHDLVIRRVGGTYDTEHDLNLALLLELLEEPATRAR